MIFKKNLVIYCATAILMLTLSFHQLLLAQSGRTPGQDIDFLTMFRSSIAQLQYRLITDSIDKTSTNTFKIENSTPAYCDYQENPQKKSVILICYIFKPGNVTRECAVSVGLWPKDPRIIGVAADNLPDSQKEQRLVIYSEEYTESTPTYFDVTPYNLSESVAEDKATAARLFSDINLFSAHLTEACSSNTILRPSIW